MKPGRYAASDGSFARSAGGAGARGLLLLAVALLIGVVLLNATDADPPGTSVSARGDSDSGDSGASTDDGDGEGGDASAAPTTTVPPTTTLPARAPAEVKVIVANASEVKGAAGGGRTALVNAKYNVLAPTNATPTPTSSVFFVPGYDRDAAAVAAAMQLPANLVKPMPAPLPFDTKGANVAVVLGADHAAKFGTAPAGATTTTAAAGAAGATTTSTTAAPGPTTSTTKKP